MGKRGARFYPPAGKPTLPNKNETRESLRQYPIDEEKRRKCVEHYFPKRCGFSFPRHFPVQSFKTKVGFTSNATNLENKMELYGPPTGMDMKREKNFSRVLVADWSGILSVGMIEGPAAMAGLAGSIFRVGSTSLFRGAAAITGLAVSDTMMVNSSLAGSTVVLVDTSALENVAINIRNRNQTKHADTNEEKWKLPVENIVLHNEDDYSVGNPAVTRCTETDSVNSQISLEVYENDFNETDQITFADFQTGTFLEHDVISNSSGHLSVVGNNGCKQSGYINFYLYLKKCILLSKRTRTILKKVAAFY